MTQKRSGRDGITRHRDGYQGRFTVGWEDGKQVRKAVYGRTIAEVRAKLTEAQHRHLGGLPSSRGPQKTLNQFAAEWLEGSQGRIRPRSLLRYEELLRLHILPAYGRTPLTKLTVEQVNRLLVTKRAGLSARTTNYIRVTLVALLHEAERQDLVHRNTAALARSLPKEHHEVQPLTVEQVRTVLAAAATDPYGPLWVLGLTTGARASELLGLRWSDVDLDAATVSIGQTIQRTPPALRERHGPWLIQPTKTEKSRRVIAIPPVAVDALRRQLNQRKGGLDLVFHDRRGDPLAVPAVSQRWVRHIAKLGLPRINWHATRHTAATFMLVAGVPLKVVSDVLGHSQISTTADVYSHVTAGLKREAADALGRALA